MVRVCRQPVRGARGGLRPDDDLRLLDGGRVGLDIADQQHLVDERDVQIA